MTACDVDKVEDGEMPEVKVEGEAKLPKYDVEGEAKLPKYDVEGSDVEVGKKKVEVEVPTVDVDLPEEEDNETPGTEPNADPAE